MGEGRGKKERKDRGFFPKQQQQEPPPKSFLDVNSLLLRSLKVLGRVVEQTRFACTHFTCKDVLRTDVMVSPLLSIIM